MVVSHSSVRALPNGFQIKKSDSPPSVALLKLKCMQFGKRDSDYFRNDPRAQDVMQALNKCLFILRKRGHEEKVSEGVSFY